MFFKICLTFILSMFILKGDVLSVNDKISTFTLPDQFDKIHKIDKSLSTIIVSFDQNSLNIANGFLSQKEINFLYNHNCMLISDISSTPLIITKMFLIPKMRDYKYPILLIYDDKAEKFTKKDNFLTIYNLTNGSVTNISFISKVEDMKRFFQLH